MSKRDPVYHLLFNMSLIYHRKTKGSCKYFGGIIIQMKAVDKYILVEIILIFNNAFATLSS